MGTVERENTSETLLSERVDGGGSAPLSDKVRSLQLAPHRGAERSGAGWVPWGLCLVLAATSATFGYMALRRPPEDAALAAGPVGLEGGGSSQPAAALDSGEIVLESKGYIIPAQQILVSPKISGMVVELNIEEGQRVRQGDVLAKLETDEYQADYDRAQATLEVAQHRRDELQKNRPEEIFQAKAELNEAQAQLQQIDAQWERDQELYKKRVISLQEYESSDSEHQAMKLRVDRLMSAYQLMEIGPRKERQLAAEAEVRQAEAELAKAKWRLDNCTILAPVSGTILKKNAEKGNIVNPIAMNGSFSLCEMADLANLEVELKIQERDVSRTFQGQQCKVRADAYPDRVYEGWVDRLMPIADRGQGAIPVRVKVRIPAEEEGVYLKPEMGANVVFLKGRAGDSPDGKGVLTQEETRR